jgi:hypothetical protein
MAAWPHGRMAAWPHGRMAAWPHGRMAAWPHGSHLHGSHSGACPKLPMPMPRGHPGAAVVVASSMERRAGAAYDFNEPLLEGLLESGQLLRVIAAGVPVGSQPLLDTDPWSGCTLFGCTYYDYTYYGCTYYGCTCYGTDPFRGNGDVVVALAFLSPGRHAGAGGDIEDILVAAEKAATGELVAEAEAEGQGEAEAEGGGGASATKVGSPGGLHTHCTPLLACHPLVTSVLVDRVNEAEARPPLKGV